MKTKIFKFATALLGGMFVLASCEQKLEQATPVFPTFEETTVTVEAGSATVLEFEANLDWEISVPAENLQWFWLDDAGQKTDKLSGPAGHVSVTVVASDVEEFDSNRVCEVCLTMGGQTQKIITYFRPAKNRTVVLYTAKADEWGWIWAESGDYTYEYNSTASESLTMILPKEQEDFSVQVKLEANFDWTLVLPEWLQTSNPTNKAGVYEVRLASVPSKLPLDGATAKLAVKDGETVVKEYDVTIPACKDIVVSQLAATYQVTAEGMYENQLSGMEMPMINSSIFAAEGLTVIAVEQRGDWYYAGAEDVSWVSIELGERETGADADVLQSQSVSLTFTSNENESSRTAYIMALPKSLAGENFDPTTTPFNADGDAIKDEYKACIVSTITQAGVVAEEEPFLSVAGGALVEKTDAESEVFMYLKSEFSTDEIYTITTNQKKFKINTAEGFWSIKLYNYTASGLVEGAPLSGSIWLDIDEITSDTQLAINSWPENDVEKGVVVFYGEQENLPLAVAYIVYDVNAQGIPAPAAPFTFAYPDYVQGATLEPATQMNAGFRASETGVSLENIYILTYTSPTPNTAVINGPAVMSIPFVWYESAGLSIEYMGETQFMVYNSLPVGENDAFCFTGPDYTRYLLICQNVY